MVLVLALLTIDMGLAMGWSWAGLALLPGFSFSVGWAKFSARLVGAGLALLPGLGLAMIRSGLVEVGWGLAMLPGSWLEVGGSELWAM